MPPVVLRDVKEISKTLRVQQYYISVGASPWRAAPLSFQFTFLSDVGSCILIWKLILSGCMVLS